MGALAAITSPKARAKAAKLKPKHRTRLENLRQVLESKFQGNSSECARAIDRSHTFMWQIASGYRTIGEEAARHIERKLALADGALDVKFERTMVLPANNGKGEYTHYRMVPKVALDRITEKVDFGKHDDFVACPVPGIGETIVCTELKESVDVQSLKPGDILYVDRADHGPFERQLYVVRYRKAITVLATKRRLNDWFYTTDGEGKRTELSADEVKVIGRVVLVVRVIPKVQR